MGRHRCLFGLAAVICASSFTGEANAQSSRVRGEDLPLYYDQSTGNVTIDTTNISGGEFVAYTFSRRGLFDIGYQPDGHTPFMPNLLPVGATERNIGETSWPNEPLLPGVYSIGNILPAGLTPDELTESYFGESGFLWTLSEQSLFTYGAYGSFDLDPEQFHVFDINYAPSPFPALNDPSASTEEREIVWATEASLEYDPGDGGLVLNSTGPNGGRLFSYQIVLNEDVFRTDEFTPATNPFFSTIGPEVLTEVSRMDAGVYHLGSVLPPDLDYDGLARLIDQATFTGEPGHGPDAIDLSVHGRPMAIAIVPEPTDSLRLAILAGIVAFAHRRRTHLTPKRGELFQ